MAYLSYSQLATFLGCHWKWDLAYVGRIRPLWTEAPPDLGGACHAGMESAVKYQPAEVGINNWLSKRMEELEEREMDEELKDQMVEQLPTMAEQAMAIVPRTLELIEFQHWETYQHGGELLVEYGFTIPLPGWEGFLAYVDWVATDKRTGLVWVWDWKFRASIPDEFSEDTNLQKAIYSYGLNLKGVPVAGSRIATSRAAVPKQPKLLKSKKGMARSDIVTTWEVYRDALLRHGFDPMDYLDMQSKLETKKWYAEAPVHRSEYELQATWDRIVLPAAHAMVEHREGRIHPGPIRNLGSFSCRSCWAKQLCLSDLRGEDMILGGKFYQLPEIQATTEDLDEQFTADLSGGE